MTSSAPALDPRPHHTAVKAVLSAALGEHDAYDYDEVPGSPQAPTPALREADVPDLFALVAVERRYVAPRRSTSQVGRSGWRLSVLCVGRTVRESQHVIDRVQDVLDESVLTIDGNATTPLHYEPASSSSPRADNGRFSAEIVYTYAC